MAASNAKTAIPKLRKRNVLENLRDMSLINVPAFLTRASLRLAQPREPINLALLYRFVVRIMCLAWCLAVRIQEVQ